jgi:hypothetical protein
MYVLIGLARHDIHDAVGRKTQVEVHKAALRSCRIAADV